MVPVLHVLSGIYWRLSPRRCHEVTKSCNLRGAGNPAIDIGSKICFAPNLRSTRHPHPFEPRHRPARTDAGFRDGAPAIQQLGEVPARACLLLRGRERPHPRRGGTPPRGAVMRVVTMASQCRLTITRSWHDCDWMVQKEWMVVPARKTAPGRRTSLSAMASYVRHVYDNADANLLPKNMDNHFVIMTVLLSPICATHSSIFIWKYGKTIRTYKNYTKYALIDSLTCFRLYSEIYHFLYFPYPEGPKF